MRMLKAAPIAVAVGAIVLIWLLGSSNPVTPAGYVGYVTQGAVFGQTRFYGLQTGRPRRAEPGFCRSPTSASRRTRTTRTSWVTTSVLSRDNLKISFSVHARVEGPVGGREGLRREVQHTLRRSATRPDRAGRVRQLSPGATPHLRQGRDPTAEWTQIKDRITPVGEAISRRVLELTRDTPFLVTSLVVGNIQYPAEVANAVSAKMAATQVLERKQTEIAIEAQGRRERVIEAEGIATPQRSSTGSFGQYLQHEAIEAQQPMVGSPNHTTIYIPVGPMGVPLVGTFDTQRGQRPAPEPTPPTR